MKKKHTIRKFYFHIQFALQILVENFFFFINIQLLIAQASLTWVEKSNRHTTMAKDDYSDNGGSLKCNQLRYQIYGWKVKV